MSVNASSWLLMVASVFTSSFLATSLLFAAQTVGACKCVCHV